MNCPPQQHLTRPSFPSLYNPLLERYRDCTQPHASVTSLETAGDIFRFTLYWTLILYTPVFLLPALWALLVHFIPHRLSRRRQRERTAAPSFTNNHQFSALSLNSGRSGLASPQSSRPFLLDNTVTQMSRDQTIALNSVALRPSAQQAFPEMWSPNPTIRARRGTAQQMDQIGSPRVLSRPPSRMPTRGISSLRDRSAGITCLILAIPLIFIIVGAVVGLVGSLVIGYLIAALRGTGEVRISTWIPLGWAIVQVHTVIMG